jgi:hypothetical protein
VGSYAGRCTTTDDHRARRRLLIFFVLLLIVRGLPSLLVYQRALPGRERVEMTFITSTTLPLLVADLRRSCPVSFNLVQGQRADLRRPDSVRLLRLVSHLNVVRHDRIVGLSHWIWSLNAVCRRQLADEVLTYPPGTGSRRSRW